MTTMTTRDLVLARYQVTSMRARWRLGRELAKIERTKRREAGKKFVTR
jgi:hypothetical protein